MLSYLDRHLRFWHVVLANAAAVAWFVGMGLATQASLPGVKLFRCPIGLCPGYYSPNELQTTLTKIGKNGRQFFAETLLPLDMVLPALLLVALAISYVWFSRPAETAVPLSRGARYAFLCAPLFYCLADYAENFTLVESLQAYPEHPLSPRAPGKLPHRREVPAHRRLRRHCRRARHRCLGPGAPLRRGRSARSPQ